MTKKQNSPIKFLMLITLFVFVLLAAIVFMSNNDGASNEINFDQPPAIEGQPILGRSDAPVTVVEFGDFKCPACKAWGETIFPQLTKDYVDTGIVKFSFINVLFHGEESRLGSAAAESIFKQAPDHYWDFHNELFKEQPNENHDSLWITTDKINEIASTIPNVDLNQLQEDMQSQSVLEEINKDTALVTEYQVQMTPSIMVNGTMLEDPFDYEKIKSLIEKELEGRNNEGIK